MRSVSRLSPRTSPLRAALWAAAFAAFLPGPGSAAGVRELRESGQSAEKAGRWEDALNFYNQVLREDRDGDLQSRIRACLRNVLRAKRHRDPRMPKPWRCRTSPTG